MEIQVRVCNVCQIVGKTTHRYEVRSEGRESVLDLCAEHEAPLVALMAGKPVSVAPRAPRAPRKSAAKRGATQTRRKPTVVSFSEIERLKQEQS